MIELDSDRAGLNRICQVISRKRFKVLTSPRLGGKLKRMIIWIYLLFICKIKVECAHFNIRIFNAQLIDLDP